MQELSGVDMTTMSIRQIRVNAVSEYLRTLAGLYSFWDDGESQKSAEDIIDILFAELTDLPIHK